MNIGKFLLSAEINRVKTDADPMRDFSFRKV